jgi:hypothetical protein
MKFLDLGQNSSEKNSSEKSEARIGELTAELDTTKQKLAQCELLIAQALDQTETSRAQYETANSRAETLRRHLSAKEEELITLQAVLHQRDERIAALERSDAQRTSAIGAATTTPGARSSGSVNLIERLPEMGLALESLEQAGTLYRLTRVTTTLGRNASNDISIASNSVSRFHARLVVEEEGVFLIDLESTNGCKVNGNRITRQMIGNADAISIGSVKFKFSVGVPAEVEARGMQETHVLLNDSAIFVPAPKVKSRAAQ